MSTAVLGAKSHEPKEPTAIQPLRGGKNRAPSGRCRRNGDSRKQRLPVWRPHRGPQPARPRQPRRAHAQGSRGAPPSARRGLHPGPALHAPAGSRRVAGRRLLWLLRVGGARGSTGLNFLSWKLCVTIMRLVILDNYDLASEWAAKYICNRIIQFRPGQDRYFTLGLPTGSTPLGCYKKLIEYHKNGDLSFKYVKTFNMDEYVGLPRNHPESYHSYMWNNFFKHIDIDPNNAHILDGNATDLQAECDAFEKKIKEAGGIDLFVGGIGPDGHIAFNEPGSSLVSRTRLKTLAMDTILANAKYFDGDLSKVPTMALTVGVGTVMDAREVMILITGAHKAFALYKAIEEGVNHMWTVSAFQQHPRTIFVCDEDATLELRVKTVKYFKGLMHVHNRLVDPLCSMKTGTGGDRLKPA